MTETEKQEIDRLVNVFLNGLLSVSKDAGWHGDSLLARWIEFAGCPPHGTGMDQSNTAMINHIRFLHRTNPDFPRAQSAINCALKFHQDKTQALLAKHYYQGLCEVSKKAYTDETRALMIGQSYQVFRHNVNRAYPVIQAELDRFDLIAPYHYALTA